MSDKEKMIYNAIRKRLQEVLNDKGTNPNRLSDDLDIPQETLNRQINQSTKINVLTLTSIYLKYPDISLPWLLCGVGEKYTTPPLELNPPGDISEAHWRYVSRYATESAVYEIPLLYFSDFIDFAYRDENQAGNILLPHAIEGDLALVITGDTMIPDYPVGACIHLRKITKWHKSIKFGYPCLIELTDKKRILTMLQPATEPSMVKMVFLNKNYPDVEIQVSTIKSVWEVLARYQKTVF